jgi:hypothetical protein
VTTGDKGGCGGDGENSVGGGGAASAVGSEWVGPELSRELVTWKKCGAVVTRKKTDKEEAWSHRGSSRGQ